MMANQADEMGHGVEGHADKAAYKGAVETDELQVAADADLDLAHQILVVPGRMVLAMWRARVRRAARGQGFRRYVRCAH
jgi:hypothetical protein